MPRFIFRYSRPGPRPAEHLERCRNLPGVTVLDDSAPRMLLVEADADHLEALKASLPGWTVSQEESYHLPGPHPSIEQARDLEEPQ